LPIDEETAGGIAKKDKYMIPENTEPSDVTEETTTPHHQQPAEEKTDTSKRTGAGKNKRKKRASGVRGKEKKVEAEVKGQQQDEKEEAATTKKSQPRKPLAKLLVNAEEPEECRVALIEDGKIESFHVATIGRELTKNNIYKGRIAAIEPNLQVAFVDVGLEKNGFLPFAEIHPEYYGSDTEAGKNWKDLHIQDVIKKGQEVLVQVVKEATGNKGASMTTYLSIPGRFLVLMPGSDSAGVSRKIADEKQRASLREIMSGFAIPEGVGYIVRTASKEITKTALSKDLRYLLRLWKEIKKRGQTLPAPAIIYTEQDIIAKFLRDNFSPDIKEILVDTQETYDQVVEFLSLLPAQQGKTRVRLHQGARPIFNYYDVEEQIEQIYRSTVTLPSGGSIVINPTEALVAIDVNSGRTAKDKDFNATIFLANMEAAAELARQLRLRDLGGLIVVDFIDMRNPRHIRDVEKLVKASMKRDKAKVDISRISKFGLMQISRQKMGSPIQMGSYKICEHCHGRGMVRSVENQALLYLRKIQTGVANKKVSKVRCRLPMDVAQYLLNMKRDEIVALEKRHKVTIIVEPAPEMRPEDNQIELIRNNDNKRS
jgi:ribonuclease E